jgi:hypothetical protein
MKPFPNRCIHKGGLGLARGVLALALATSAGAAQLNFSAQSGPRNWAQHTTGSSWTFYDVHPGLDMVLTLTHLSAETDLKVHPVGDQLKVAVRGRSDGDRLAEFSASFLDQETQTLRPLQTEFLLTDIDYKAGQFAEEVWMDHAESFGLMDDSHLATATLGSRVTAVGTRLDVAEHDERAWMNVSLAETSRFDFGWGFRGLATGRAGTRQRGLVLGATLPHGVQPTTVQPVPEPTTLIALLAVGLFCRRP